LFILILHTVSLFNCTQAWKGIYIPVTEKLYRETHFSIIYAQMRSLLGIEIKVLPLQKINSEH